MKSYLETALWSSTDENDEPFDRNYGISDFSNSARKQARAEVEAFLHQIEEAVLVFEDKAEETGKALDFDDTDIGHDFWLTRNGHGAGFWDRPKKYGADLAEILSEYAAGAGERDLYVGDDGTLYFEPDQRGLDLRHPKYSGLNDVSDTIKQCGCGKAYTKPEWDNLHKVGQLHTPADEFGPDEILELKNCSCGSTMALEVLS